MGTVIVIVTSTGHTVSGARAWTHGKWTLGMDDEET